MGNYWTWRWQDIYGNNNSLLCSSSLELIAMHGYSRAGTTLLLLLLLQQQHLIYSSTLECIYNLRNFRWRSTCLNYIIVYCWWSRITCSCYIIRRCSRLWSWSSFAFSLKRWITELLERNMNSQGRDMTFKIAVRSDLEERPRRLM